MRKSRSRRSLHQDRVTLRETSMIHLMSIQISQEESQVVWYSHLFQNYYYYFVNPYTDRICTYKQVHIQILFLFSLFKNKKQNGTMLFMWLYTLLWLIILKNDFGDCAYQHIKAFSFFLWRPSISFYGYVIIYLDFPCGSAVKNLFAMQETQVQSLGWEDPQEKEMAAHRSILAWEIPWTEEPCGLQSRGSCKRVRHY